MSQMLVDNWKEIMHQPALPISLTAVRMRHPTDPEKYMPAWVAEQLQANEGNSARRVTKYRYCDKCEAIVMTGLDHDHCAFTATVDPTPLDPRLELAAIIAGRRTYAAWPTGGQGYHLELRDDMNMEDQRHPVLPSHLCGARFPGFLEHSTNGSHNGWDNDPAF